MARIRWTCAPVTRLALALAVAMPLLPGGIEKKFGTDAAKTAKKVDLSLMSRGSGDDKGTGPVPYLPALGGLPKRVALASFYVVPVVNESEWKSTAYNYTVTYTTTVSMSGLGREHLANAMAERGVPALKESFAAAGVSLLTPAEFLDTDAKKAAYQAFKLETGGLGSVMNFLRKNAREPGFPAEGYRSLDLAINAAKKRNNYELAAQGGDGKLFQGLGHDLAAALDVDAVLVVYNPVLPESKSITLCGTYAYLFGPNPVKGAAPSSSWTGHQYAGAYLDVDLPMMVTDKKGTELENDYEGYAHVTRALGNRMVEYLQERIAKK